VKEAFFPFGEADVAAFLAGAFFSATVFLAVVFVAMGSPLNVIL
jgi:hypothetical protein